MFRPAVMQSPDFKFTILSHGNGWAFEVRCNETGYSFWVQDHDADELVRATDNFRGPQTENVLDDMMSVFGEPSAEHC